MRKHWAFLILLSISCKDVGTTFRACDDMLRKCAGNPTGAYCTFGYKWGEDNLFSNAGVDRPGPGSSGGIITYGYYDRDQLISTHSQTDVSTVPFERVTACEPHEQIERALKAWSSVADLEFLEVPVSQANIKFAVADITQGGIGYPSFTDDLCQILAGLVVLDIPSRNTCDGFYNLVLHEIGHSLGLGHVNSDNIMNPSRGNKFTELEKGDIDGIRSIYGEKSI